MAASSSPNVLMEERQNELMISPSGGNPTQRTAHFLIPILPFSSSSSPPSPFSESSNFTTISDSKKIHHKSLFQSHRHPPDKWKAWVDHLKPTYQHIWNQAGIYHSIMSSTQKIPRDKSLIMGLAERWCLESNTFIFPWGEATLTLEDMVILGGYSVLGDSVLCPLNSMEDVDILTSLKNTLREIRINGTRGGSHLPWMDYFMTTGNKFEHQAFLVFWLSRFVFTKKHYITADLFSIAIHLSNGTPIALAPAVLASIYRDFRFLKSVIVDLSKLGDNGCIDEVLKTPLSSPFQLVQLWAWKRFRGEPRLGQQNGRKSRDFIKVREALDLAEECFLWRPYAFHSSNSMFGKMHKEDGTWVLVDSNSIGRDLEMYARCLRVSELVGLDCIEQYLPNRVAMQFGFDQDIPGYVTRCNGSYDDAWSNYCRPISDIKLYVPARLFEADVTSRYLNWYKGSTVNDDLFNSVKITMKKRSSNHNVLEGGPRSTLLLVQPVSSVICDSKEGGDKDNIDEDKMPIAELLGCQRKRSTSSDAICIGDKHVMKPQFPSASYLVASDGDIKEAEFVTGHINMSTELPKNTMEETDSRGKKDTLVSSIRDEDKGSWIGTTFKLPELELEVRISRLERQAAALKAAKSLKAAKCEEKLRKVS